MKTYHAVKAESFNQNTTSTDANTLSGALTVTGVLTATGGVVGNVTGDVSGAVTGNVTGDVIGVSMATAVPAGITGGVGTVITSKITKAGHTILTQIFIDLTGLGSSTTDLDIIGVGTAAAYIGRILAAESGQIYAGKITCLEAATGGINDIDLYAVTEATGKFDDGVAALAETAIFTAGSAWTLNETAAATAWPAANAYLYLTCGAAGTPGTYTAGQFLIEFWGYEA